LLYIFVILWHAPTVFHRNNEYTGTRMNWEDFGQKPFAFSRM
jgi:hypothetical protein